MSAVVALVTCSENGIDPDENILLRALSERGIDGRWVSWDEPGVDWASFSLSVVRSTWDYVGRRNEFLDWARHTPRLCNPAEVLIDNTDKRYLARLASAGVTIVPTSFVAPGESFSFPDGDFVVKPTVGAGSMDAERYGAGEVARASAHVAALHDGGRVAMIQPYVSSVDDRGEVALVFIDGQFAHAMRKGAMLNVPETERGGLFRVEQMSRVEVDDETINVGRDVLRVAGFGDLLYGRVDIVHTGHAWAVMELELTEPSLFLSYAPETATSLAAAIQRRLVLDPRR